MTDEIKKPNNVDAVAGLAREAYQAPPVEQPNGSLLQVVPAGSKALLVREATRLRHVPDRIVAHRSFHSVESFGHYVMRYKTEASLLVADIDHGHIRVTLDYHAPAVIPASCDHVVSLALIDSDEWTIWNDFEGSMHDQGEFMLFLEQYAKDLISPDEASILELVRDFAVTEGVVFKSAQRLDNGDRRVTFNKETQTGDLIIPKKLIMSIPLYRGEPPVTLEAHFRYRIAGGELKLGYVWHRAFDVRRAAFELAVTNAADATGLTPLFGSVVPVEEGVAARR